jgi:probable F420-dependent oxidoreductase
VAVFTVAFPMLPADQLVPLARAAEEAGFDSITVPDSVFYPERVSAAYPYSADGSRFWAPDTPFVDPFVAVAAMTAVTTRIRFYTNVLKLPIRNPLLVAKQVASLAVLSGNRFALGVGLSWMPEEFVWTGTEKRTRGARTDEAIEIIKMACAGKGPEWIEYHGRHYEFDRLMISPAPDRPIPVYVGGHASASLRRAARHGDGWIAANITTSELTDRIKELGFYRAEYGREDDSFVVSAIVTDAFDPDGYQRLADLGVTHIQTVPWYLYGGDPHALETRRASLYRFADEVLERGHWGRGTSG